MVRDPEAAKRLMQEQVVGTAHSKVQNAVSDIQNKYAAILNLENSVNDLLELFSEMALLIERNGELIDKVETNFDDAHSYVE
jgi:t-SNARE complex subunit (syntaxin)